MTSIRIQNKNNTEYDKQRAKQNIKLYWTSIKIQNKNNTDYHSYICLTIIISIAVVEEEVVDIVVDEDINRVID